MLEERDIQVRGYTLRLPLDLLLVASANPEDYTNRGRIITPLKDRFGAEVRTHYPLRLDDELALIRQEALLQWGGDARPAGRARPPRRGARPLHPRWSASRRRSTRRSGVSARFAVAAAETVAASAVRRAAVTGEMPPVARVSDLPSVVPAVRGKVEFDALEEGREAEVLAHLLRRATADTFRARLAASTWRGLQERFEERATVETGELVPAAGLLAALGPVPGLAQAARAGSAARSRVPRPRRGALEFALEGLHLTGGWPRRSCPAGRSTG